jgi:hypothetical protein
MLGGSFAPLRVIDFRDASPFRAAVLSSILVMEKDRQYAPGSALAVELIRTDHVGPSEDVRSLAGNAIPPLIRVPRLGAEPVLAATQAARIPSWPPLSRTWHLGAGDDEGLLRELTMRSSSLDQLFERFSVGIKTTADDVFVAPFNRPGAEAVEQSLLHPLLRGGSIAKWRTTWDPSNGYDRYVLYPHERDSSGRTVPVNLDAYPGAKRYLETHRVRLESRRYVREAGRRWYEIWVPQRIDVLEARRKLVFPDFSQGNRFALDWSGAFVGASAAFGIPRKDLADSDLWYVLFLLNSPLLEYVHQRFLHVHPIEATSLLDQTRCGVSHPLARHRCAVGTGKTGDGSRRARGGARRSCGAGHPRLRHCGRTGR